jgi:FMN reductase
MSTPDKEEDHLCKIVGISGSVRPDSYTTRAVALALKGAEELGCQTKLIDLREYQLVFCDGKDDESHFPEGVFRLREEVKHAQGIILGTPEYHGGYSGVLKNALDLMGFEEFEGKMLGLVGVSGGPMGAFGAMNSLREVGRALHAWVVPEQASIPQAWREFDDTGKLKNSELEERVRQVGRQVARFAYLHGSCEANEFLQKWEKARENPGGEAR